MNDETQAASLHYEINLECVNCGHVQAFHCDETGTHSDDPCGCFGMRHRATPTTGSISCTCERFVRPSAAPGEPSMWWDHGHQEASA